VKLFPVAIPIMPMRLAAKTMDAIYSILNKEAPFSETKLGFFLKNRAFSIKKAQSELGYEPIVRFEEGMKKTIQWYWQQRWLL
jgi:nucleoside-diphosphate-sugar epimerase